MAQDPSGRLQSLMEQFVASADPIMQIQGKVAGLSINNAAAADPAVSRFDVKTPSLEEIFVAYMK